MSVILPQPPSWNEHGKYCNIYETDKKEKCSTPPTPTPPPPPNSHDANGCLSSSTRSVLSMGFNLVLECEGHDSLIPQLQGLQQLPKASLLYDQIKAAMKVTDLLSLFRLSEMEGRVASPQILYVYWSWLCSLRLRLAGWTQLKLSLALAFHLCKGRSYSSSAFYEILALWEKS